MAARLPQRVDVIINALVRHLVSHFPFRGTHVLRERGNVVQDLVQGVLTIDALSRLHLLDISLAFPLVPFETFCRRWRCGRGPSSFSPRASTAAGHGRTSRFSPLASTAAGHGRVRHVNLDRLP